MRLRKYVKCIGGAREERNGNNGVFLEIKRKSNRTVFKKRAFLDEPTVRSFLQHPFFDGDVDVTAGVQGMSVLNEAGYLQSRLRLEPKLLISYVREPFVSKDGMNVRITFDSNVRYRDNDLSLSAKSSDKRVLSPNHVIMEIKYTDYFHKWLVQMIERNGCQAQTFSKYGVGMEHCLMEQMCLANRGN